MIDSQLYAVSDVHQLRTRVAKGKLIYVLQIQDSMTQTGYDAVEGCISTTYIGACQPQVQCLPAVLSKLLGTGSRKAEVALV